MWGCLSTRSPHRPNPIGLSICEIHAVGDDYIEISSLDLVDGTPVLDVKPVIPYDLIPFKGEIPMAWLMAPPYNKHHCPCHRGSLTRMSPCAVCK